MDLKNMTIDDLKQKLSGIDKKTLIKFGIGVGAVILFLIIYYVILSPMVKERRAIFDDKILKENEINKFENDIITLKKNKKKENLNLKLAQLCFIQKLKLKVYMKV